MTTQDAQEALEDEIAHLEQELALRKLRLAKTRQVEEDAHNGLTRSLDRNLRGINSIHALLLLSDSALPLGSFAYSSGLESYLSHRKNSVPQSAPKGAYFEKFLHLSVSSVAHTNLPYLLTAYRCPALLQDLDNDLDASTPCTVARRASIAQGRAMLGVWERSFRSAWTTSNEGSTDYAEAVQALEDFSKSIKLANSNSSMTAQTNGHFAPIWGATSRVMGLDAYETSYVFLINHAKAVLSAAVRASVMGPYQAQSFLAGNALQGITETCIRQVWDLRPEDAGQVVPAVDLWVGRHELLYSRIFNS